MTASADPNHCHVAVTLEYDDTWRQAAKAISSNCETNKHQVRWFIQVFCTESEKVGSGEQWQHIQHTGKGCKTLKAKDECSSQYTFLRHSRYFGALLSDSEVFYKVDLPIIPVLQLLAALGHWHLQATSLLWPMRNLQAKKQSKK